MRNSNFAWLLALLCVGLCAQSPRPRARDLGIEPGIYPTGRWNAISDVAGVRVGHRTVIRGDNVRTGVTAILPHGGNLFVEKLPAAMYVLNGFGKLIGMAQVEELGVIETPILLTHTLGVWRAADALKRYMLDLPGNEAVRSVNVVVGETNSARLHDVRGDHLSHEDFLSAIQSAENGPVEEGSVGAGTGTVCFGWKGGIGTSSRVLPDGTILGVLVQTNFGGNLTIDSIPVWKTLKPPSVDSGDGSIMMIVATDAALDARQLKRLCRRAPLGLARTGSSASNGSGDFVIAFSTARGARPRADSELSPLFQATIEATEEAIYNSLLQAKAVTGKGGFTAHALPIDRLRELLESAQRGRATTSP